MEGTEQEKQLARLFSERLSKSEIKSLCGNEDLAEDVVAGAKELIGRYQELLRMARNGNGYSHHGPHYPGEPFLTNDRSEIIWLHRIKKEYDMTEQMIGRRETNATAQRLHINPQRLARFVDRNDEKGEVNRWKPKS